jgi:hypothetical protein
MKFTALCVSLFVGSAAGLAAKGRAKVKAGSSTISYTNPSTALPFGAAPNTLDGSLIGDAGFDPIGFSGTNVQTFFDSKNVGGNTMSNLQWLREAEITHGRIAQLAVLGFIWPAAFGGWEGNEWSGVDAFKNPNPLGALEDVPYITIVQIILFMAWIELYRVSLIKKQGASRVPGDLSLGQGKGRWNPFRFDYSPEEYEEKQLQELKNGRLAMLGAAGLYVQCANSGKDIVSQLGDALKSPEYYAKAGYFFPEGI